MLTPLCENCGSRNTAHYKKFTWFCQDCGNLTPGRGFISGDPHIQKIDYKCPWCGCIAYTKEGLKLHQERFCKNRPEGLKGGEKK